MSTDLLRMKKYVATYNHTDLCMLMPKICIVYVALKFNSDSQLTVLFNSTMKSTLEWKCAHL